MKCYYLRQTGDSWELREEGGPVLATYARREQAIRSARRTVKHATGTLKIFKPDGTLDEERTWHRSPDRRKRTR